MARMPRIEFDGALYHLLCRGDRREAIFRDDTDRDVFLSTLGEICQRNGWRVHAYVLMSNHYHLLVETPKGNLVRGMHWFQATYTMRYNHRHELSGHLFAGRYKSLLIDPKEPGYFVTVSDYIHLNPARAHLTEETPLGHYPWSSLPWYGLRAGQRPGWLEVKTVLGELGWNDAAAGRRKYLKRLEERARERPAESRGLGVSHQILTGNVRRHRPRRRSRLTRRQKSQHSFAALNLKRPCGTRHARKDPPPFAGLLAAKRGEGKGKRGGEGV